MKRVLEDAVQMWPELFRLNVVSDFLTRWQTLMDTLPKDVIYLIGLYSENIYSLICVNRYFRDAIVSKKLVYVRHWMLKLVEPKFQFAVDPILKMLQPESLMTQLLKRCNYKNNTVEDGSILYITLNDAHILRVDSTRGKVLKCDHDPKQRGVTEKSYWYNRERDAFLIGENYSLEKEYRFVPKSAINWKYGSVRWTGKVKIMPYGTGTIDGEEYTAEITYKKVKSE